MRNSSAIGRVAALIALAIAVVVLVMLFTGGEDGYEVDLTFENASQLVKGNEVVVGGAPAGSVKAIELGDDNQAIVTISISEDYAPLKRGTVATVRSPSLSQVAGRQVQLTLPVDTQAGEEIADGGVLTQAETVSEVDLDQIFNTLDPKTIEDFKHVIQGFELSYEGVGKQANEGARYLNPFLSTSRRVFSELTRDQQALENLIVDGAQFSGALASRSGDLSALVSNLNVMTNAIGDRRTELAEGISLLPDFMRQANTTFVNLRAALDDLDPLVVASRPAARELAPFLGELRAAASDAVPTIRDLDAIAKRPGRANDLVELTALQPALSKAANGAGSPDCGPGAQNADDLRVVADDDFTQGAFGESVCALENGLGALSFFRAYSPDALGWFNTFSHIGGIDATGGLARIGLTLNTFSPALPILPDLTELLDPNKDNPALNFGDVARCPGANERDPGDGSTTFTDGGALTDGSGANGECDPTQGATGP